MKTWETKSGCRNEPCQPDGHTIGMRHYPIAPPDPVDAIILRMEQMGMTKADMVQYLGSQSRVSEILNKRRKLTLGMIKALYKGLKIPAEILLA